MIGPLEPGPTDTARYRVTVGSRELVVEVTDGEAGLAVQIGEGGEEPRSATVRRVADGALYSFVVGGRAFAALVDGADGEYTVVLDGKTVDVRVEDERAARLKGATAGGRALAAETSVVAPMPGLVLAVNVEPGQAVSKGTSLVVLQAMKMENDLTAREDAIVKAVLVSPGQTVDQGQTLLALE